MRRAALVAATICIAVFCAAGAVHAASNASDSKLEGTATIVASTGARTKLPPRPHVTARAYIVFDATDDRILAAHDQNERRAIASLTKMMTSIVVLARTKPSDTVTISQTAVDTNDGSALNLSAGQRYTVGVLFKAMLVHSANDAAEALGEHTGPGIPAFEREMNAEARSLDMLHTHFTSPHGLDEVPDNYSTAADVLKLARAAMREPAFRAAVRTRYYTLHRPGESSETFPNRNDLLFDYPGVDGVKTGFTSDAGECLVTHYKDRHGTELYVVVLGASSEATRDSDSRALLDWGRAARPRIVAATAAHTRVHVPVANLGGTLDLAPAHDLAANVLLGMDIAMRARTPRAVHGPVRAGTTLGSLTLLANGHAVAEVPLVATRALAARSGRSQLLHLAAHAPSALNLGFHTIAHELGINRGQ